MREREREGETGWRDRERERKRYWLNKLSRLCDMIHYDDYLELSRNKNHTTGSAG